MSSCHSHHHWLPIPFDASVRVRLTLWYLAVMGLIIFVFGGSLYGSSQIFLNGDAAESRLEAQLYQDSQRLAAGYRQALLAHGALTAVHLNLTNAEMALLLAPDGNVFAMSGPLTSGLIQQLQARAAQTSGMFDLAVPMSHPHSLWQWTSENDYRVLVTPVLNQNARVATLLVGLPRPTPTPLLAIWLFWGTMALLVAAIGGYWLAGKVLQPVKMITHTANQINATDLRRRLHLQRRDEFGELADTFDHMLARLEAAFKRQTQLTADASHELRTPLTIIDLEINRALTQLERPEDYRQVLEHVRSENERLMVMVNDLLLLARADTGQMTLETQEVDLSDIALASVERLLPLAQANQIHLVTGDLPEVLVRGDPRYLGQMLTNLIENAIKHSSGIGKRVHVELAIEQARIGVVRIQDDGPGIPEEHLPYLFERFYRVDKARSRRQKEPVRGDEQDAPESGGTGLGLSIVQWIVQAHCGEARVESTLGVGSQFEVRLPLLPSAVSGDTDDESMTLQSDHVHGAVIFPSYAGSGTISMVYGKEPRLTSLPTTAHQSSTAFRVIVVLQTIVFLFAATLHTGLFGVPALYPAMVVEGLCGIGCVISAFGQFTHQLWAPRASLIIQILILFGVLLGILAVATDASIRTPLNVGLHAVMLVLILLGLLVLAVPGISRAR